MSKNPNLSLNDELDEDVDFVSEEEYSQIFGEELTKEDFGVIIDSKGRLKSICLPENCETLPKHIVAVLKACGIDNAEEIYCDRPKHTLH